MVEEDRYCADVIVQIARCRRRCAGGAEFDEESHAALRGEGIQNGKREEKESMYEELLGLMELAAAVEQQKQFEFRLNLSRIMKFKLACP